MLRSLFLRSCFAISVLGVCLAQLRTEAAVTVHYLMIQGDFNSSLTGTETYKFRFEYDTAVTPALGTGQDLLNVVFGVRGPTPTLLEQGGLTKTFYHSTNGAYGATYEYFESFDGYIVSQFTINGQTFPGSPLFTGSYWNYQAAGGSGDAYGGDYPFLTEDEPPVLGWTSAWDGIDTRYLANGSFDGYTYGNGANSEELENLPTASNYSDLSLMFTVNGISVYGNAVPEPGRAMLIMVGLIFAGLHRFRRKTGSAYSV